MWEPQSTGLGQEGAQPRSVSGAGTIPAGRGHHATSGKVLSLRLLYCTDVWEPGNKRWENLVHVTHCPSDTQAQMMARAGHGHTGSFEAPGPDEAAESWPGWFQLRWEDRMSPAAGAAGGAAGGGRGAGGGAATFPPRLPAAGLLLLRLKSYKPYKH